MSSRFSSSTKGAHSPSSSTGAAFLILVITLIIIFYILFLDPSDREALLSGGIPGTPNAQSGGYNHLIGDIPLKQNIGAVDFVSDDSIEHKLNSFTMYTTKDATLIKEVGSLYVKNSAFDTKTAEILFTVDKRTTENVLLSFNIYSKIEDIENLTRVCFDIVVILRVDKSNVNTRLCRVFITFINE